MDPQQELFSALLLKLKALGYDVYDGALPPDDTPYPFIYLGDNAMDDINTKTAVLGEISQTVHIWHNNVRQRGTVSKMLLAVKDTARKLENTQHFGFFLKSVHQTILPDNSTSQPLLHGVLQLTFKLC